MNLVRPSLHRVCLDGSKIEIAWIARKRHYLLLVNGLPNKPSKSFDTLENYVDQEWPMRILDERTGT